MRRRFLVPAVVGLGLGAIMLALQAIIGFVQVLTAAANVSSINVPFPVSLVFYSGGAILLETLYRLILITLPLWLIANVALRGRGQTQVFWVLAFVTSAHEPVGQMTLLAGHVELMVVLGGALYATNLFEALLLRRHGFLAPVVLRLAYYSVWHVAGSALGY